MTRIIAGYNKFMATGISPTAEYVVVEIFPLLEMSALS